MDFAFLKKLFVEIVDHEYTRRLGTENNNGILY
jgi:hypothetical protein